MLRSWWTTWWTWVSKCPLQPRWQLQPRQPVYCNLIRYKETESNSSWRCMEIRQEATDTSHNLEKSKWILGKRFHFESGKYRSRLHREAVQSPSLEAVKTHWTQLLLAPDLIRAAGRAVWPLEVPSKLCTSVIPWYFNKYFSRAWSKSKIFLHPWSVSL